MERVAAGSAAVHSRIIVIVSATVKMFVAFFVCVCVCVCCWLLYGREMEDSELENSGTQKLLSRMLLSFDRYFTSPINFQNKTEKTHTPIKKSRVIRACARASKQATECVHSTHRELIKVPFTLRINRLGYLIKIFATTVHFICWSAD